MNEQWIQQVRQKMDGYRRPAPEVSWNELDWALAANKSHKNRLLWLMRMAAVVLLLLVAGAGYWSIVHKEVSQPSKTATIAANQPQPAVILQNEPYDTILRRNQRAVPVLIKKIAQKYDASEVPAMGTETGILVSTLNNDTASVIATGKGKQPYNVKGKAKSSEPTHSITNPPVFHQQKYLQNRFTAQIYMSSTMRHTEDLAHKGINSPLEHPQGSVQIGETDQYVHHRQPVRLGFSLRYEINNRWSVESGLSYTRLSSDITTTVNDRTTVTQQRLDYIGIPLNISYNLWNNHNFGLYVTAGGMIEKRLDASPWQFSLSGATGIEYKLTDHLGLYAEPGFGYYFSDGSTTPTIYQDHPLNFNLSFGLRFNLK